MDDEIRSPNGPGPPPPEPERPAPATPAPAARLGGPLVSPLLIGGIIGIIFAGIFLIAYVRRGEGPLFRAEGFSRGTAPSPGRGEEGAPSVLFPIGRVEGGPIVLRWEKVRGIDEYEASIFDSVGQPLWRSGRIRESSVTISPSGMNRIQPGPSYLWRVVGYTAEGEERPSPTVRFAVGRRPEE